MVIKRPFTGYNVREIRNMQQTDCGYYIIAHGITIRVTNSRVLSKDKSNVIYVYMISNIKPLWGVRSAVQIRQLASGPTRLCPGPLNGLSVNILAIIIIIY